MSVHLSMLLSNHYRHAFVRWNKKKYSNIFLILSNLVCETDSYNILFLMYSDKALIQRRQFLASG